MGVVRLLLYFCRKPSSALKTSYPKGTSIGMRGVFARAVVVCRLARLAPLEARGTVLWWTCPVHATRVIYLNSVSDTMTPVRHS